MEAARGDIRLTEFEFVTLAAFSLFSREGCEAWVLEVGLGGRLDAVNAIDPDVSVITRIAMDHQDWLGDTLDSVAAEKAGILRAGRPAFYGAGVAPPPIAARAAELEAPLYQAGVDFGFERHGERWDWHGRTVRRNALKVADPANAAELPNASLAFAVPGNPQSRLGARRWRLAGDPDGRDACRGASSAWSSPARNGCWTWRTTPMPARAWRIASRLCRRADNLGAGHAQRQGY